MATNLKSKINCYFLGSKRKENIILINALEEVLKDLEGKLYLQKNEKQILPYPLDDVQYNDISKADFILTEYAYSNNEFLYGLGLAHAFGKPVIALLQKGSDIRPSIVSGQLFFEYQTTKEGIEKFKTGFKSFIVDYLKNPSRYKGFFPFSKKNAEPSYIIDPEKLEPREYENLCFELISQMGFRKVSWGTEMKDFDVVATLPKKDPDGFEYQEIWLIVTGNKGSSERLLEMTLLEPEYLLNRLQRAFEGPNLFTKNRLSMSSDTSITVLFILKDSYNQEIFDKKIARAEMSFKNRRSAINIRIRTWDSNYLIKLIQTYPQIAFKYFSEQSRVKSKYRKSPEELYDENVTLTEKILRANAIIEEEKRKRFIAERETAWKDVAFKAAHKLGNPVDATDTFLQSLKRNLELKNIEKAKHISNEMDNSIEEAKAVIGQFKSLTKIEEINAQISDVLKIIKQSCKTAEEQGVSVSIKSEVKEPKAYIDPVRITECFNELVANSLHWFDKKERKINITLEKVKKKEILEQLDSERSYLKIIYSDNGSGVILDNKEKIFSPFFSTYQHGTGLGLSIVKKVIELQDGWIIEKSSPGEGASFVIFLPITKLNRQTNK